MQRAHKGALHHQEGLFSTFQRTGRKGYLRARVTVSDERTLKCRILIVCFYSAKPIKAHADQDQEGAKNMRERLALGHPLVVQIGALCHMNPIVQLQWHT